MALAFSVVTDDPDTANASSYDSPSVTPTGGAHVVVCVQNSKTAAPDKASIDTPTWLDGAWTEEADVIVAADNYRMTVWSGKVVASPSADTITASFAAAQIACHIRIIEITGGDADIVRQAKTANPSGNATEQTITLDAALVAATSQVLAFFGINDNSAITPADGETELQDTGHSAPTRRMQTQHKLNDTSSSVTFASATRLGVALEIAEAAGGGTALTAVGGIASAEAFGTPSLVRLLRDAGAIASAEALGAPSVRFVVQPLGIATAEAHGTGSLRRVLAALGIASAEAVGEPRLVRWVRQAGGIASAEAVGQPTLGITLLFSVGGIASQEAVGEPRLTRILQPIGIVSAEAFGTASLVRQIREAGGIASAEAFGVARVLRVVRAQGIASAEAVGEPRAVRLIYPVSIASLEAFGIATVGDLDAPEGAIFGSVLVSDAVRYGLLVADDEMYLVRVSDAYRFAVETSDRPGG